MSSPGTWAGRLEPQTHRQGLFPGAGEPGGRWCLTWWFWLLRGVLWETRSRGGQAHETCAWEWHGTTSALFFASHGHGAHPDPPKGRWERTRACVPPSFSPPCFPTWDACDSPFGSSQWSSSSAFAEPACMPRGSEFIGLGCSLGICIVLKSSQVVLKCGQG